VLVDLEVGLLGCGPGSLGQGSLEAGGGRHILDGAAVAADEVVVVLAAEVLGELEAAGVVGAGDAAHDVGVGQDREGPVGRAHRDRRGDVDDLGDRQWAISAGEHLHDLAAIRGVALIERGQPQRRFVVNAVTVVSHWRSAWHRPEHIKSRAGRPKRS